jgi:hypothetical protein
LTQLHYAGRENDDKAYERPPGNAQQGNDIVDYSAVAGARSHFGQKLTDRCAILNDVADHIFEALPTTGHLIGWQTLQPQLSNGETTAN